MENIWVGEDGTITLYGAGEHAAINQSERPTVKDDLQQLAAIIESNSAIKTASPVSIDFTTIGEIQDWLDLQKSIAEKAEVPEIKPEPKRKPAWLKRRANRRINARERKEAR
jgi:hypothetical protein